MVKKTVPGKIAKDLLSSNALADVVDQLFANSSGSLTEFTNDASVMIRTYIENTVAEEEICTALLGFLSNQCAGFVMTALGMEQIVSSGKSVRDLLQIVSSESFVDAVELTNATFGELDLDSTVVSMEAKTIELEPKAQKIFAGKVLEIDFQTGQAVEDNTDGKPTGKAGNRSVTLLVYLQLIPHLLSSTTVKGFVDTNFNPPASIRFKQVLAGEISFVRDFLFARDRISKYQEAMKKDKSGVLYDMLSRQNNALSRYLLNLVPTNYINKKQNLANAILIMDKSTFDRACTDAGIKFESANVKQKFFNKTFTMMLVVVDTMHNIVDIYYNSISGKGEYSYNMISKVNGSDDIKLKEIMTTLAAGRAPRY